MARPLYFVGPWDLNRDLACVPPDPQAGSVVLVESEAKGRALPWHKQKLVLVLSAMRHFAHELEEAGYHVSIVRAKTYAEGLQKAVKKQRASEIIALMPREYGLSRSFAQAVEQNTWGVPLTLHDDGGDGGHYLLTREAFAEWAQRTQKKSDPRWRMDTFYRWMRQRTGWLMDDKGKPEGGKYSFDAENRKPAKNESPPSAPSFEPDAITRKAMAQVKKWPSPTWGELEPFRWPVTRAEALQALDAFFAQRAEKFGDYQDAMLGGEPFMWHTLISSSLNLSLLHPQEVCERVLEAQANGTMPLAAAEGLLRQIMGWREFMRGIYWQRVPQMRITNTLKAHHPLPKFYWEPAETDMNCVRTSVQQVHDTDYGHHIQRLMVLGNFALIAGVDPHALSHWFWAGFVDAYEWVELPNVMGMATFADTSFTTKPYAAAAAYIDRMSDYCKSCPYNPKERVGSDACPFNALFWAFMHRHRTRLEKNIRLKMLLRTWDKWDKKQRDAILRRARQLVKNLPVDDTGWTYEDDAA